MLRLIFLVMTLVSGACAAGLPIQEHKLDNGMKLLVLERHDVPVVSCQVWYHVGSAHERPNETGLAHFLEHMMFKGTDVYKKGDIDKITQRLGGSNNATTFYDFTDYYFNFASDRWWRALEIEANRMKNCLFDAKEVESERQVVLEERQKNRDAPWGKLVEEVDALTFQTHPYHNPVIGWLADLEAVPRSAFVDFYKAYYTPNNAALVIVGDVKFDEVKAKVVELFGKIPAQTLPVQMRRSEPEQECERRLVYREKAAVSRGVISFRAPPRAAPESVVLDVLETILGSGKVSRLYQRLVEKEKLCTSVSVDNEQRRDHNLFQIYMELLPGKDPAKVEAVALEEIAKVTKEPVTDAELKRALNQVQSNFVFEQESAEGLASKIGQWVVQSDYQKLNGYLDAVAAVKAADVKEKAARYFTDKNRTVGWSLEGGEGAAPEGGEPEKPEPHYKPDSRGPARDAKGDAGGAPAPAANPTAGKLDVQRFTLANGLKVLALPRKGLPVIAVRAWIEGDERYDPEDKAGLAAFAGRMLEEGTAKRDHLAIADAIESVGGSLSTDENGASGKALSKDTGLLLELIADCLSTPTFPAERVEQLRERILAEIAAEDDEPAQVGAKAIRELVYEGYPLHRPSEGYAKTVKVITVDDLKAHHKKVFSPAATTLSVVGDFDVATLKGQIEKAFGGWKGEPVTLPALPKIERQKAGRERFITMDREQVNLYLGHLGTTRTNPDHHALQVMDSILGTSPGFTDRLSKTLRDEQGLAYTVNANIASSSSTEPGMFLAYIGCSPKNRDKALAGMKKIIEELRTGGVTPEELKDAQDYLTGSFVFRFETAEQVANLLISLERYQLGDDYVAKYPELVRKVTREDVERVAKQYLDPAALTHVEVGPAKK